MITAPIQGIYAVTIIMLVCHIGMLFSTVMHGQYKILFRQSEYCIRLFGLCIGAVATYSTSPVSCTVNFP